MEVILDHLLDFDLRALTTLKDQASHNEILSVLAQICCHIAGGSYEKVLKHPYAEKILNLQTGDSKQQLEIRVKDFLQGSENSEVLATRRAIVLACGVTLLNLFVQANWTGPALHELVREAAAGGTKEEEEKEKTTRLVLEDLSVDGELMYAHTQYVHFLQQARWILVDLDELLSSCYSYSWWSGRCMFIWQQMLSNSTATLKDSISARFQDSLGYFADHSSSFSKLAPRLYLEMGLFLHYYQESEKAKEYIKRAQDTTGLYISLTGALGRRTRYQEHDVAQLVLEAASRSSASSQQDESQPGTTPKEVKNPNELLLPELSFSQPVQHQEANLDVLDQCIILSMCLDVKNNNPRHGLTTEEMFPYVRRVQKHPNNWMVHSMCLLLKSRLEMESTKSADRAALQLQVLVDQFYDEEKDSNKQFNEVNELGEKVLQLGAAASALQIFERFEMWENVINCYKVLGKRQKAEQVVKERLGIQPTPELWCLFGDLVDDPQHYVTSWEISGCKYARAKRSLAFYYIRKQKWEEALEHFEVALAINPLYMNSWFSCGCAAMHLARWDKALKAFSRVVQLDNDQPEAWANMASVYIKMGKKNEAFRCLTEGLKHSYDNWKMWQNYLYVAMDLGEFQQALQAMVRLVDLAGPNVDTEVLEMLVNVLLKRTAELKREKEEKGELSDEKKATAPYIEQFRKKIEEVLAHVTSKITNNYKIWAVAAKFYDGTDNKEKALDCRLKQMRCASTAHEWHCDNTKFQVVAESSLALVEAYMAQPAEDLKKSLFSAKLHLRSILKKAQASFQGTEAYAQLESALQRVQQQEQQQQE